MRQGFRTFFVDHHAFVWRCLRRFGVAEASLDDAVQDVFVTAHRRRDAFAVGASPRAWLAGIARRIAFRHRRTRARELRRHDALTHIAVPEANLDDWIRRGEARAFLDRFLESLGGHSRELFVLVELEGLRGREAAAALGINMNTAYSRLRIARARFEEACASGSIAREIHAADQPDRGEAQRTWCLLVAQLPATKVAVATSGLAQLQAFALTVAIGSAGVFAASEAVGSESASEPVSNATVEITSHAEPRAIRPRTGRSPPPAAITPEPAPPIPAATMKLTPSRASPRGHVADEARAPSDLSAQLALVDRARAAADEGRWAATLATLEPYWTQHASADLVREAVTLAVVAHCALGDRAAALRRAEHHLGPTPGRLLVQRRCPSQSSR